VAILSDVLKTGLSPTNYHNCCKIVINQCNKLTFITNADSDKRKVPNYVVWKCVYKQLVQSCYIKVKWPSFEPVTS